MIRLFAVAFAVGIILGLALVTLTRDPSPDRIVLVSR